MLLKSMCSRFRKTDVIDVTEEYTSKTCGRCGFLHNKIGSRRNFVCPKCKVCINRDVNGARNVLLKYKSD